MPYMPYSPFVWQRFKKIEELLAKREAARDERVVKLDAFLKTAVESANGFAFANCADLTRWLRHEKVGSSDRHSYELVHKYDHGAVCSSLLLVLCLRVACENQMTEFFVSFCVLNRFCLYQQQVKTELCSISSCARAKAQKFP